ncbi:MAG: histidine phosphatase family protein [Candidatus Binatia bacterium]
MNRVLLIRHGETEWNRERRWQGHANVPLSPEGMRQAERLARWLCRERPGVRAVYSSDLDRAVDTARAVAAAYGVDPILDPAWREMDVGAWSGLGRPEIEIRFAEEWRRILAGEDLRRGGGETFGGFTERIVSALERLPALHPGGTTAVVTHGGVIRAALLHLRGLPFARLREIAPVENAAFAELSSNGDGWQVLGLGTETPGSVATTAAAR